MIRDLGRVGGWGWGSGGVEVSESPHHTHDPTKRDATAIERQEVERRYTG